MSTLATHYSANDIETRLLDGIRAAGLDPDQRLSVADLGALDHFHTGGLRASMELMEVATIEPGDNILDLGAGLGGAARMLATETGCHVDCVEMSADYCSGARLLNRLTGLETQIAVHQASALDLPFADATYDVVWMQNVGMNIEDKLALYTTVSRVLKPGGCFAFQEMVTGTGTITGYPLPWASVPEDNSLTSAEDMTRILEQCHLHAELFEDTSGTHLNRTAANATPAKAGALGLSVFVDNLGEKATNARLCLEQGQVRLVRGIFRRR